MFKKKKSEILRTSLWDSCKWIFSRFSFRNTKHYLISTKVC